MKKVYYKNNYLYYKYGKKLYRVPYSELNLKTLEDMGYSTKSLLTLGKKLTRPLYHYQLTSVVEAQKHDWNLLLADVMGAGKSSSAIAIHVASKSKRTLIVVPSNIKLQWKRNLQNEIKNCPHIKVCSSTNYDRADLMEMSKSRITIINYDILNAWVEPICEFHWDLMILDESQKIKTDGTGRTIAAFEIRKHVTSCVCLSGTPLTDRNADIFNTVKMVNPSLFPSRFVFDQRYCNSFRDRYNRASVSINTLELHKKLTESGTMLRRTKKDIYKEIPKVQIRPVPFDVTSYDLKQLEDDTKRAQKELVMACSRDKFIATSKMNQSLEAYLQEAIRIKLPLTIDWINDFLEQTDDKLVVACVHRDKCGTILHNTFRHCSVLIDGSVSTKRKDEAVQKFINDPDTRLLIGNIQSVSAGIDGLQTVCSTLLVCELCWSPGDLHQLYARLDRNGQTNPVVCYTHFVVNSLDEKLARMLDRKTNILSEVLDGYSISDDDKLENKLGG